MGPFSGATGLARLNVDHSPFTNAAIFNGRVDITGDVGIIGGVGITGDINMVGNIYLDGSGFATVGNDWFPSDSLLKENIQPMGNVQAKLDSIIAYTFNYDTLAFPNLTLPKGIQGGFLAQQLELIFPELVKSFHLDAVYDSLGNIIQDSITIKAIYYPGLVPYLLKGLQNQQQVTYLQQLSMDSLRALITTCCNLSPRITGSNDFPVKQIINLASSDPILYQNIPNPFNRSTEIRYFIPENAINPKIIFQDDTGRTINETAIREKGQASIELNAVSLNSGIYTYSLQINGKIIDSKKMLKSK
ncbi:MAG: tail fiber domain-containing protein [Bacteroidia bacterium]